MSKRIIISFALLFTLFMISNSNAQLSLLDSDSDGLNDSLEIFVYFCDENDPDTDNDGFLDGEEVYTYNTIPNDADTDDDGLSDFDEITGYTVGGFGLSITDPLNDDTDSDFIPDGREVMVVSPISGGTSDGVGVPYFGTSMGVFQPDNDNSTATDPNDSDSDSDGLLDGEEDQNQNGAIDGSETDPIDADTDDDGINDRDEDLNANGVVDFGETDPLAFDTDSDGLHDGLEIGITGIISDGNSCCLGLHYLGTDGFSLTLDSDPGSTTDPLDYDTDDDGIPDGVEDVNQDGAVDFETDPNYPDSDSDGLCDGARSDNEGDGIDPASSCFGDETSLGTDPLDNDSDNDYVLDGVEIGDPFSPFDTDSDGTIDALDTDDDGDSVPTKDEDIDGNSDPTDDDTDSDGIPNYLDDDDDGDGILTIDEDVNGNGDLFDDDSDNDGFPDFLDPDISCCVGIAGDINNDGGSLPDISDLLFLVDYMFLPPGTAPSPVCLKEADVNGDGGAIPDISDLLYLVDYMFLPPGTSPAPAGCL